MKSITSIATLLVLLNPYLTDMTPPMPLVLCLKPWQWDSQRPGLSATNAS